MIFTEKKLVTLFILAYCVSYWKTYTSKAIFPLTPYSLFYQAGSGPRLSKEKLLHYLLEGTAAASNGEGIGDEEKDTVEDLKQNTGMLLVKFFLSSFAIDFWVPRLYDSMTPFP